MDRIPVFLICDDNYAPYMAVMIASICSHTACFMEFHVIGTGISPENQQKIDTMKIQFENFSIDYRTYNAAEALGIPYLVLSRMTPSTYIRMLLPEIYPEIDRALVMDVDMISLSDISPLWKEDTRQYIFAAAPDSPPGARNHFLEHMEVDTDCMYANCGLMLIDCRKWRDEDITGQCIEIEKKYRDKLWCADQDVINKVFLGNFKKLDSRYNSLLGEEDNIINRHFCAERKPWNSRYNIEGDLIRNFDDWWTYAKLTPFYDELLDGYNRFNANGESAGQTVANYKKIQSKFLLDMIVRRMKYNNGVSGKQDGGALRSSRTDDAQQ